MMTSESKTANAIAGKTARPCDSCLSKRARWFCPADDAFLCQSCDVSVHSANQLASRHERVRLETSSNYKSTVTKFVDKTHQPAWHQGFTRKARTPRNGKKAQLGARQKDEGNRVPEIGSEEISPDENEEQLLYRVPVFDPFEAELSTVPDESATITNLDILLNNEDACDDLNLPEFLSSDIELAEFAADVESLLGEDFGVIVQEEERSINADVEDNKAIKIEVEDEEMRAVVACHLDPELDRAKEALKWNFDEYYEETVEQKVLAAAAATEFVAEYSGSSKADEKRRLFLRLNHEAVISAWPNQSSPWTNGIRPHFNPDDCWPDFLESCGGHQGYGGHVRSTGDGGREARVSRYREKRRTRLFSKKIRYEVRKLNAEKRPRLKGRFIKRTSSSFSAPGFSYLMNKR